MAMKEEKGLKCHKCSGIIDEISVFCKHCGAPVRKLIKGIEKRCPKCRTIIDEISVFCKHCGVNVERFAKRSLVWFLNFVIVLILIGIVIAVFFGLMKLDFDKLDYTEILELKDVKIEVEKLECNWKQDHYEVCESVFWSGGDYAKGYIAGGESLENSEEQLSERFVYCQDAGKDDGFRIARAVVYDDGNIVKDFGEGVECKGKRVDEKKEITPKVVEEVFDFANEFEFIAKRTTRENYGEGVYEILLPEEPESCEISGNWITKESSFSARAGLSQYCDGASGSFVGYWNENSQMVISDADMFNWAGSGKGARDPDPLTFNDYAVYLYSCDSKYYDEPRVNPSYVRARLKIVEEEERFSRGGAEEYKRIFGIEGPKNELLLEWEYYNKETVPDVEINGVVKCKIKE